MSNVKDRLAELIGEWIYADSHSKIKYDEHIKGLATKILYSLEVCKMCHDGWHWIGTTWEKDVKIEQYEKCEICNGTGIKFK